MSLYPVPLVSLDMPAVRDKAAEHAVRWARERFGDEAHARVFPMLVEDNGVTRWNWKVQVFPLYPTLSTYALCHEGEARSLREALEAAEGNAALDALAGNDLDWNDA